MIATNLYFSDQNSLEYTVKKQIPMVSSWCKSVTQIFKTEHPHNCPYRSEICVDDIQLSLTQTQEAKGGTDCCRTLQLMIWLRAKMLEKSRNKPQNLLTRGNHPCQSSLAFYDSFKRLSRNPHMLMADVSTKPHWIQQLLLTERSIILAYNTCFITQDCALHLGWLWRVWRIYLHKSSLSSEDSLTWRKEIAFFWIPQMKL